MKKIIYLGFIGILLLYSCGKSQKVKNAEQTVSQFFSALKKGDSAQLAKTYPLFHKLPSFFKSDSIEFVDFKTNGDLVDIQVKNRFTNIKKKTFEQNIWLTVNGAEITDSKGMCRFIGQQLYDFGLKTGCVSPDTNRSDQTIVKELGKAEDVMVAEAANFLEEMRKEVPISDVKTKNLFGFVSGEARVTNNSKYPIYYLKYEVAMLDENGKVLSTDWGFASADTLAPGADKQFTFINTPPPDTKSLDVRLIYDKMYLYDILTSKTWTGKECENYLKKKPQ